MRRTLARMGAAAAAFTVALACSEPSQPAAVTVAPDSVTLQTIGQAQQLTATVTNENGKTLLDALVTWGSSKTTVARVDSSGRVVAVAPGTTDVTATAGGVSGSSAIVVDPANNLAKAGGDGQYGYRGTRLAELIAVRVRDQYGNGVVSYPVEFVAEAGNGTPDSSVAFTDGSGVARTGWVLPNTAATVTLQARVQSLSGSTVIGSPATFSAVAHNVRVSGFSPQTVSDGQTLTLTGDGFDAANAQNVVTIDGTAAAVTGASLTSLTVTVPTYDCRPSRNVTVQVTVGGIPATPVSVPLTSPVATLSMSPGQQVMVSDPTQFCFHLGSAGAQETYLIGVQSTSEVPATLTPITLIGFGAGATAAPAMSPRQVATARVLAPQTAERLRRWRAYRAAEVRQRERDAALFPTLRAAVRRAAPGAFAPRVIVPDTADVGDKYTVRVSTGGSCSTYTEIGAQVRAEGANFLFLADTLNPIGYTDSHFTTFVQQYDTPIYQADTTEFGPPPDSDANGRVVVVVTKEVNKRDGSLGFATSCDLAARADAPASNEGEFFYLVSPDPTGTVSGTYALEDAVADMPNLLAHELVHVVQFGRRKAALGNAPFVDIWTAEGQAVLGEEVVGHAISGNTTGQNYGLDKIINADGSASIWYGSGVVGLGLYFGWDPFTTTGVSGKVDNAPWECTWLATDYGGPCVGDFDVYGTPWSLLRYLSDRFGPAYTGGEAGLQKDIIENAETGFAMLSAVSGMPVDSLLAQWAAMLYLDDITGTWASTAPALSMSSWNLDHIFYGNTSSGWSLLEELRLSPDNLVYSTFDRSAKVRAASAYYAVISGSNRLAFTIKARDASGTGMLPGTMRYWIVRIQ